MRYFYFLLQIWLKLLPKNDEILLLPFADLAKAFALAEVGSALHIVAVLLPLLKSSTGPVLFSFLMTFPSNLGFLATGFIGVLRFNFTCLANFSRRSFDRKSDKNSQAYLKHSSSSWDSSLRFADT